MAHGKGNEGVLSCAAHRSAKQITSPPFFRHIFFQHFAEHTPHMASQLLSEGATSAAGENARLVWTPPTGRAAHGRPASALRYLSANAHNAYQLPYPCVC